MASDVADKTGFALLRKYIGMLPMLIIVLAASAMAQTVQLTTEQQRILNQLPPEQREAAMQQLRNLASGQATSTSQPVSPPPTVTNTPDVMPEKETGPPVLLPQSTVVLGIQLGRSETAVDDAVTSAAALRLRLLAGNPYVLDPLGRLNLAGVGEIGLAGLNEEQAALRLNAEPALAGLLVKITRLPLKPVGVDALTPFGYELFKRGPDVLTPNTAMPVAADYVVGPGDTVHVQLFGNQNAEYELPIDRNGTIRFPGVGPISVAGLSYVAMQDLINQRVSKQFIGTQVSVTLGELRGLQIFVVGDVNSPGSYSVSPMSTITTALAQCGGIAEQGSMRRVQLKRNGELIQTLDVYDLLLRGNTRADARLRAGDVVFVPPVGTRVAVAGEVNRPAIYEYIGAANVADIIGLAGGLKPTAHRSGVKVERFEAGRGLRVIEADQARPAGRELKVSDGDTLIVPAGVAQLEDSIILAGNVQRPGEYQWRPGLRISDLIRNTRDLKAGSDLNYLLIRREVVANSELAVLSADLQAAWRNRGGGADITLQPRDTVYVFDLEIGREHIVDPLIAELQLRTSRDEPLPVARVGGRVKAAGDYPIESGMRVSDLIRAAGGLDEAAYLSSAEISRYDILDGEKRETELIELNLERAIAGDPGDDLLLQPFDYLNVKELPRWRDQAFVEIGGEVTFPGRYAIEQGETLTSLLKRAGGLTPLAFPRGSVYTRESLKLRERDQLEVLAKRVESDLTTMSLADSTQSAAASIGQSLLEQLRNTEPVGRLVVNLENVIKGIDEDIILRDGDRLLVPLEAQEVTVLGEVQYATSHLFDSTLSRDEYIDKSGGVTRKADKKNIYVVRASGEVLVRGRSRFLARAGGADIEPGDTIVVPLHTDKVKPITLWTSATQIIYNLAIAAAAVNSF